MAARKDGKPYKKATKQVVAERVDQVYKLLMKHRDRADIIEYCAKNFDVTERQSDMYIKKARERYRRIVDKDPEEAFKDLLSVSQELLERTMDAEEYETARKVVADLTRLRGLDRADEINVNVRQERVANVPTETLGQFIRQAKEAKKDQLPPSAETFETSETSEQSEISSKKKEMSE